MNFFSVRDFRTDSKKIWDNLSKDGEAVITVNGKPNAFLINIEEDNFEETIKAVRQAKAMIAFNSLRMQAAKDGFLSDEEIENEIELARK